jgi:hypothetical protein
MDELNTGFGKLTHSQLVLKAQLIASSLSQGLGLRYFPAPVPTVADLESAIDAFTQALGMENSSAVTALRAKCRQDLIDVLKKLAANLSLTADGDLTKLAATGFDVRKRPTRSYELPAKPVDFEVRHTGISGEARGTCKPVSNAVSYEVEFALSPDGPWIRGGVFTSSQKLMFSGLERGRDYFFRVRVIGATGPGPWSDISSIMVI